MHYKVQRLHSFRGLVSSRRSSKTATLLTAHIRETQGNRIEFRVSDWRTRTTATVHSINFDLATVIAME